MIKERITAGRYEAYSQPIEFGAEMVALYFTEEPILEVDFEVRYGAHGANLFHKQTGRVEVIDGKGYYTLAIDKAVMATAPQRAMEYGIRVGDVSIASGVFIIERQVNHG